MLIKSFVFLTALHFKIVKCLFSTLFSWRFTCMSLSEHVDIVYSLPFIVHLLCVLTLLFSLFFFYFCSSFLNHIEHVPPLYYYYSSPNSSTTTTTIYHGCHHLFLQLTLHTYFCFLHSKIFSSTVRRSLISFPRSGSPCHTFFHPLWNSFRDS